MVYHSSVRLYLLSLCAVLGCSSSPTTLVVQVETSGVTPAAVTVSVFDRFGLLGRSRIDQPVLPGAVTVQGLPDTVETLRVIAVGESPRVIAGLRFDTEPRTRMTRRLTLGSDNGSDADADAVPDALDDCPLAADPDQGNSDGDGSGDACPGSSGGADLAALADLSQVDLAGADLAPSPPDLLAAPPLLTEDFEAGIGSPWSTNISAGSSLTVDGVHVHRGTKALHVHSAAITPPSVPSAQVDIVEQSVIPLPDFYMRAFVFVPSGADPTSVAIFAFDQATSPFKGVNLNLESGSFSSFNNIPTSPITFKATTPMPTNQWVCLEWRIKESTNGYARVFVEGTEVSALSGNQSTQPTPPLGLVGIGLIAFPSTSVAARDVWFDDVIIDNHPIGCVK
jgi:hypothetical protein